VAYVRYVTHGAVVTIVNLHHDMAIVKDPTTKSFIWLQNDAHMWHAGMVSNLENLVAEWLPLPDLAEALDVSIKRVHSLIDERAIIAVRVGERNIRSVPAAFLLDGAIVDSLKGTISVLKDSGYEDHELLVWLFTPDESLNGTPMDALRAGRKTEIRRRAQALSW
jgi:hypothetical protein